MSDLQYPDALDAPDLQIWNNAAFDHGGSEPFTWASSGPDCVNLAPSRESDDCSKENHSPDMRIGSSQFRMLNLNPNLSLEPKLASQVSEGIKWKDSPEGKVQRGRERDMGDRED